MACSRCTPQTPVQIIATTIKTSECTVKICLRITRITIIIVIIGIVTSRSHYSCVKRQSHSISFHLQPKFFHFPFRSNNRKSWSYYSNHRQAKNKSEINGNYCSSNSSTTSSTNSTEKLVSNKLRKGTTSSTDAKDPFPDKKAMSEGQPPGSPTLSLKALSLSDSETSNPKAKTPASDYFRLAREKASSCTSSLSSPVMSTSPQSFHGTSLSTSSINSQPDTQTFLLSIDKNASTSTKAPSQDSYFMHSNKSASQQFSQGGGRRNFSMSSGYISNASSMLSDDMHGNMSNNSTSNSNANRYRMSHPNMVYRDQTYFNVMPPENYTGSPIRSKQFLTAHTAYKRRCDLEYFCSSTIFF